MTYRRYIPVSFAFEDLYLNEAYYTYEEAVQQHIGEEMGVLLLVIDEKTNKITSVALVKE